MKKFADFAQEEMPLDGDKAKIDAILNEEIAVLAYRIRRSRYSKNSTGEYLTVQFELAKGRYVCFTGSDVLIEQFRKYGDQIPFQTVIRKINRYYTLT